MNKELMYRVADAIEKEIMVFDMQTWGETRDCGTCACVAGHVMALERPESFEKTVETVMQPDGTFLRSDSYGVDPDLRMPFQAASAVMLELNRYESEHLFLGWRAFPDLRDLTDTPAARRRINENRELVPDALRWMADNDKIDWNAALQAACEMRNEKNEQGTAA